MTELLGATLPANEVLGFLLAQFLGLVFEKKRGELHRLDAQTLALLDVRCNDPPQLIEVDVEVTMNEPIARAGDRTPRDVGEPHLLLAGDLLCRLADDFDEPCEGEIELEVGIEILACPGANEKNRIAGGVEHVL